ncbi:MAG TPA: PDZ domain-containing protein [Nitrososphaerales archaeon]|nr:PDZ domain-containing protein [Nitrososphaerales archaeon]
MLKYSVSMENPNNHYFEVAIDILDFKVKLGTGTIRLVMPTWTPGSYLVREFSRNVLDLIAFDIDEDTKLVSRKTSKNVWEVDPAGATNVRIKYRVYGLEFTVDTSYLDNLHAIINGASVFMYVDGLQHEELVLTVFPDPDWKVISTGLENAQKEEDGAESFLVPNFDILVDSPIEVGNQQVHSFYVNGVRHEVSIFTQKEFDQTMFVSDLRKIVETTIQVFSQIPYERYVFLIDFSSENYGGLEHLNSTHCIAPLYRLEPVQEYRQLLSLFSHEFFHVWNVKRMRPVGLGPFNYTAETYTNSLWIAEGITSYYDDYILRRAGIYTLGDYLDAFCSNVSLMKSLPGSKWQSAEEASFDAWIKHYRQDENSPNVLSSYYLQGTVIGWMLDMEIRKATASMKNLDDALRMLYQETFVKENRGYMNEDFERICADIIGANATKQIFDLRVRGRHDVDFDKYLGYAGLKTTPKKPQTEQGFLGVKIRQESARLVVAGILSDNPAETSGLVVADEIIALDGLRMDSSKFSWYVTNRKPETPIKILVSRLGSLLELTAETTFKPLMEYRIAKRDQASDEEKKLFKSWLGVGWETEIKYEDYPPSPSKKALFDYI